MSLPERKGIGQFSYPLHREVDIRYQPPGVSSGARYQVVAERPRIDPRLTGESEYLLVDEDIGGVHLLFLS
jgi:hypothetical protein